MAEVGLAGKSFIPIIARLGFSPNEPASIVALIQLTRTTITTLIQYGIGVKNMTKDKNKTIDQLWSLQKVLEDVQELVEDEQSKGTSRLPGLIELEKANGLPSCLSELKGLQAKLETKQGRADRTVQALMWPLKQGEVKKTLDYLGEFQKLLSSVLNIDNTYAYLFILRLHLDIISMTDG